MELQTTTPTRQKHPETRKNPQHLNHNADKTKTKKATNTAVFVEIRKYLKTTIYFSSLIFFNIYTN